MTSVSSDLVDPDGCKLRRFPVNDAPQHRMTNTAVHPIPAGTKDGSHFAPGHAASPRAQKPFVSGRHPLFAAGPFQVLGLHATGSTVDTPHRVQKEDLHAENGDELKATFRSSVINRTRLPTGSTSRPAVRAGSHRHQNLIVLDTGLRVDKPLERIPSIEDSLQLHLVADWLLVLTLHQHQ